MTLVFAFQLSAALRRPSKMHSTSATTIDDLHIDLPSAVTSRLQAIPLLTEANILAIYFDWNDELRALLADLGLTIVLTQIENIPEFMLPMESRTHPDKEDIAKYILVQRIGEDLKQKWRALLIKNWPKARLVYYGLDDMWADA